LTTTCEYCGAKGARGSILLDLLGAVLADEVGVMAVVDHMTEGKGRARKNGTRLDVGVVGWSLHSGKGWLPPVLRAGAGSRCRRQEQGWGSHSGS
jgi:hypothetical protein